MLIPVTTKAAVLQALAIGPAYGAEIVKRIRDASSIKLTLSCVYPSLIALEDAGLAREKRSKIGRQTGVCPYEITAKGRRTALENRVAVRNLFVDTELNEEET